MVRISFGSAHWDRIDFASKNPQKFTHGSNMKQHFLNGMLKTDIICEIP